MRLRLLALVLLSVLIKPFVRAQSAPAEAEIPSVQVDKLFEKMDRTVSPDCALAVMKDARIIYERGYGMADLDHNVRGRRARLRELAQVEAAFRFRVGDVT